MKISPKKQDHWQLFFEILRAVFTNVYISLTPLTSRYFIFYFCQRITINIYTKYPGFPPLIVSVYVHYNIYDMTFIMGSVHRVSLHF